MRISFQRRLLATHCACRDCSVKLEGELWPLLATLLLLIGVPDSPGGPVPAAASPESDEAACWSWCCETAIVLA